MTRQSTGRGSKTGCIVSKQRNDISLIGTRCVDNVPHYFHSQAMRSRGGNDIAPSIRLFWGITEYINLRLKSWSASISNWDPSHAWLGVCRCAIDRVSQLAIPSIRISYCARTKACSPSLSQPSLTIEGERGRDRSARRAIFTTRS